MRICARNTFNLYGKLPVKKKEVDLIYRQWIVTQEDPKTDVFSHNLAHSWRATKNTYPFYRVSV
jgi:hypothetical protein